MPEDTDDGIRPQQIEAAWRLDEERLEALLRLNQMMDAPEDEIVAFALEEAVRLTHSTMSYIAFLSEDERWFTGSSYNRSALAECRLPLKPQVYEVAGTGLWGEAVRRRQAVITNDYTAPNPAKRGFPEGHLPMMRHMNVPVFEGERIVAVTGVANKPDDYDTADVRQLTLLMAGVWQVFRHNRAERAMKERARQQEAVARLGLMALRGTELPALMDAGVRTVAETLGVACSQVLELLPGGQEFLLRAAVGWQDGNVGRVRLSALPDSPAGYTVASSEPVIIEDMATETRFRVPRAALDQGLVSGMSVAIHGRDGPFGVLGAHTMASRRFSADDAHFLQAIANVLAEAIEHQRTTDALRESEARNRSLFDNAPISLWEEDFSEVRAYLDRLRGQGVSDFWQHFADHPDEARRCLGLARLIDMNRTSIRWSGAANREELLAGLGRVAGPAALAAQLEASIAIAAGQTASAAETVFYTLAGEQRHVILRWAVVPGYEESCSRVLVSLNDITEQRRAQAEVEASLSLMAATLEATADGIVAIDFRNRGMINCNDRFLQMWGLPAGGLIGFDHDTALAAIDDQLMDPLVFRKAVMAIFERPDDEAREILRLRDGRTYESNYRPQWLDRKCIGGVWSFHDVTAQSQAEERLRGSEQRLRTLADRLQRIREEERTRIAREIHDELGQQLTACKLDLALLRRMLAQGKRDARPAAIERIGELMALTDDTIATVRRIATDLRPAILDDQGLVAAIEWQTRQFEARTEIRCVLDLFAPEIKIDPQRATAVFRIYQELLTNVARHARASRVGVRLALYDEELVLEVRDNGRGMTGEEANDPRSLGLLGMRERAGSFGGSVTFAGVAGQGTVAMVAIPLVRSEAAEARR